MLNLRRLSAFAGVLALSLPCAAQAVAVPSIFDALSQQPVDGSIPGSKRFNVVFNDRSFTLDEFRMAIETGQPAEVVQSIVDRLQTRVNFERAEFGKRIEALGGKIHRVFWLIDAVTVEIAPDRAAAVRELAGVQSVDPDLPTAPLILTATNASNHATDAVQAAGNRGTGFAAAIIDTGQDSNMGGTGRPHRTYFRGGLTTNTTGGGLNGSLLLANVQSGAQPADDTHGHGTGVASIVAGSTWGGAGADNGHANDAGKVGFSICDVATSCNSSLSTEAAAWQAAAAQKVRYNIVAANMSYGSSPTLTDVSQQAIDAAALNANIVACTAAGNSGTGGTGGSSATANGLAVAAATNNTKAIASFSTRGPMATRTFPDIAANGVNTVMAGRNNDSGNYVASGTSMASPQVCGVATLVKFARPNASARDIKAILLASSENVTGYTENAGGQGYLRTDRAIATAQSPNSVINSQIGSTTAPVDHQISVVAGQTVKIALTWFRHTLTSASYSNLGLTVLNGAATVAAKNSAANLYEVVSFTAPITGTLTVRVNAVTLVQNPQPYSIAANATTGAQPQFQGGTTGAFAINGTGCVGTRGIPSLHTAGNPRIAANLVLNLSYAPATRPAILFLGVSNTTWLGLGLPFNMGAISAPNCFLRASGELTLGTVTDANGTGSITIPVPNSVGLVTSIIYNQFLVNDPAANTFGWTTSNSARVTIGDR